MFIQNHLTINNLFLLDIIVWVCRFLVLVLNSCGGSKMAAVMLCVTTLNWLSQWAPRNNAVGEGDQRAQKPFQKGNPFFPLELIFFVFSVDFTSFMQQSSSMIMCAFLSFFYLWKRGLIALWTLFYLSFLKLCSIHLYVWDLYIRISWKVKGFIEMWMYPRGNMLGLEFYYHHNKHNKLRYLLLVLLRYTFCN